MKIALAGAALPETGTAVVLATDSALSATAADLDRRTGGAVSRAIELAGGKLKRGQALELLCPAGVGLGRIVVLGIGAAGEAKRLDLEVLGGSLAVRLKALRVAEASVAVDAIDGLPFDPAALAVGLATGARLRSYRFDKYRTSKDNDEEEQGQVEKLTFHLAEPAAAEAAWNAAAAVVAGVREARDLVSEPANVLSPERFAEACQALGQRLGMAVDVLGPAAIRELGMNALLAVGQGSQRESRVAVLRWNGGAADQPPVALIGKGVCFDSGGLSLKPAGGMEEMKWDMGGAGAVYGAMAALAGRKAKANVVGVLGLTENMPSGQAQRPGDVITAMSGLTIEVVNTDAEGRLLLADVLHYARERFKPRLMVDLATLTGAIVVALGHEQAGMFSSDDKLAEQLAAAGAAVGEK
ncbi:MAG TPA: leucyl aminopeptidase, partial [Geminicoccaceae bacterium]|nr:leucyl aminopeptidase [Geminicoccaceae bacterium]